MATYKYKVRRRVTTKIRTFYANVAKKYNAYRIDGDTIIVEDACHEQNMYD